MTSYAGDLPAPPALADRRNSTASTDIFRLPRENVMTAGNATATLTTSRGVKSSPEAVLPGRFCDRCECRECCKYCDERLRNEWEEGVR